MESYFAPYLRMKFIWIWVPLFYNYYFSVCSVLFFLLAFLLRLWLQADVARFSSYMFRGGCVNVFLHRQIEGDGVIYSNDYTRALVCVCACETRMERRSKASVHVWLACVCVRVGLCERSVGLRVHHAQSVISIQLASPIHLMIFYVFFFFGSYTDDINSFWLLEMRYKLAS